MATYEEYSTPTTESSSLSVMELPVLEKYLVKAVPVLLDAEGDVAIFEKTLKDSESSLTLKKFITSTQNPVLLVQKVLRDGQPPQFSFSLEVNFGGEKTSSVAIIKRNPEGVLEDTNKTVASQVHVINLGEGTPFETLHNYIHNSFGPLFRSFTKIQKQDAEKTSGISSINQRIADLELSLYNSIQNVQIDVITLKIHPAITSASEKCNKIGKTVKPEDIGELVQSEDFLNTLQGGVNSWIKDIQKVTKLERIEKMPATSDSSQEVKFWYELESELKHIEEQLKTPEAECTLNILKQAKRFITTAAFDTDTIGLRKTTEVVNSYKPLMKEFPINELLAVTEMEQVSPCVVAIFNHLRKTIRNSAYPTERYLRLLESLARDLCDKVTSILQRKRLMYITDYEEFDRITTESRKVFSSWDEQFEQFREAIRELARKRGQTSLPLRVTVENKMLQEKIDRIRKFRRQHNELKSVITRVLPDVSGEASSLKEINDAYDELKEKESLFLAKDGNEVWDQAVKKYDSRIDRVENQITAILRDKLATAKNANEMFRVFSKFNALFVRPRIKGAIQEYQAQLIQRVKMDIATLHDKFKGKYNSSEAYHMSQLRDLPPVTGAIIWARQLERQLNMYLQRVEDVLGKGWELDIEGQKLKQEGDMFKRKLNTEQIFDKWVKDTEARNFEVSGRIFEVEKKGNRLVLDVNFDSQIITLFKEVRNLNWLGFRVPFSITLLSSGAKQVYPFAVSLKEILRTFTQTCAKISPELMPLVAIYKKEVQSHLNEGFRIKWEGIAKLEPYVKKLSESVIVLRDKVDDLLLKYTTIRESLQALEKCPLKEDQFSTLLGTIQKVVDELNLGTYSNLSAWVLDLDERVEDILATRLSDALREWNEAFKPKSTEEEDKKKGGSNRNATSTKSEGSQPETPKPTLKTSVHEILIRNQVMSLNPPLEHARVAWISQLHSWLSVICDLSRIQSSRYDEGLSHRKQEVATADRTYRDLLTKLPSGMLETAYNTIESKLQEVQQYVNIWLQYQALWDMESHTLYSKLGNDLSKWQQLLGEIKRSRTTFDNSSSSKNFGPIIIDYAQVQASVNNKYDYWHKDVISNFGSKLNESMKVFFDKISTSRKDLERLSVETVSTAEAVGFIIQIQELKKNVKSWEIEVNTFSNGQQLLQRQRFQFPSDWLDYDMVEAEWTALNEILTRKSDSLASQIPALQTKIMEEEKVIDSKIRDLSNEWNNSKPLKGEMKYTAALDSLKVFDGRVARLKGEYERVKRAKEALDLDQGRSDNSLRPIEEEIQDLTSVWNELSVFWKEIEQLKDTLWSAIIPRKIRHSLEEMLNNFKNLPNRMRQYAAFTYLQNAVKTYLKYNTTLTDLKSEALRERHWKDLRKRLNATWVLNELTLGNIWDSDLQKHEEIFKDIILTAQGELALEEFIRQVREFWSTFQLDLVPYQNKCRLIRGWDDIFNKLTEHSGSLSAMKISPYYKVFEEEAGSWDEKLNRIRETFDVWIDVQRRWVYLEGIFSGSSDINALLPTESSRFKSINTEFINLMKKVSKSQLILDVLNIEGLLKSLERLADLLGKIQKALGEYLERQRAAFPRFYFVGDEDLLEIIGNSKDLLKIMKHLKKMFAGLAGLLYDDEAKIISGMTSREGETVPYINPISLKDGPKIHEWLTSVENEMKKTLATLLERAVNELPTATSSKEAYLTWIEKYPDQLILIAAQILWSGGIY